MKAVLFFLIMLSFPVSAFDSGSRAGGIYFYYPEEVMTRRSCCGDDTVKYFVAINEILSNVGKVINVESPSAGAVVVAALPHGHAGVWFVVDSGSFSVELKERIYNDICALPRPTITEGPIALAFKLSLAGAAIDNKDLPLPHSWKRLTNNSEGLSMDEIFAEEFSSSKELKACPSRDGSIPR